MLSKLRAMLFGKSTKKTKSPVRDPNKCQVKIQLAGKMHSFYQEISFVESLTKAMTMQTSTAGCADFFEFKNKKGHGYSINLRCIDYAKICEDVYEISSDDAPGYSIYLKGKEDPFVLGELSAEQVDTNLVDQGIQFLRLGNYYFKRDEVALICALK
jgi:hypothetical protein